MPVTADSAHSTYSRRRDEAKVRLAKLDQRSAFIANLRLVLFLGAIAFAGFTFFDKLPTWGYGAAAASLVAFGVVALVHQRIFIEEQNQRRLVNLNERGLYRLDGGWRKFPERGERFALTTHQYTPDLDVFGQGSLFQLLNETATRAGENRLAGWLVGRGDLPELRERQAWVRELAPQIDFRQSLILQVAQVAQAKADPAPFIRWAEEGTRLDSIRWARPFAWILPPLTLALFILGRVEVVPRPLWWAGMFSLVAVAGLTRRALSAMYEQLSPGEVAFTRFENAFGHVEGHSFTHPGLKTLAGQVGRSGASPSHALARFSRIFGFVELRRTQVHPVVHLLTLWDIHWMFRLERWREQHRPFVRGWFESLATLEAVCCLATLSYDRPQYVFPELTESGPQFTARALGHPLLDAPVENDVTLPKGGFALLVTGSNMSGKSTLLRAMGLNAVLALAGAPVHAASLQLSQLEVLTSMRVIDSLERGVSLFYAEVQRLKQVLDAARGAKGQAMFLLDEILLGTNTRERQIASKTMLRLLLRTGACGAVTTHDLSLAALADDVEFVVKNVHFRDHIEDGKMRFDYRLKEGVVDTTNALRVLQLAGIEVDG